MPKTQTPSMRNKLNLPTSLGLRSIKNRDQPFLETLFLSARPQLQMIDLPEALRSSLVSQQFLLQQNHYRCQWPHAEKLIVTQHNIDIGKIILAVDDDSVLLIDLALLPNYRRRGIGKTLLNSLQQATTQQALSLKLSVDKQNSPAKRLYLSLGFKITDHTETHFSMSWTP